MSNDAAKQLRARLRREAQAINERNRVPCDRYYKEPSPLTTAKTNLFYAPTSKGDSTNEHDPQTETQHS
jgi:hypothetical protein